MLLAGDLGGTKTDLALYTPDGGPRAPVAQGRFPSAAYPSLAAIVQEFLARHPSPVTAACFDVAGPVVAGCAQITNLPWMIDARQLKTTLGVASVTLLNDLEAIARALPILQTDDMHTLRDGTPTPGGAIAIVAPGTGLGEAFLTWNGRGYKARPSEGGHADFAPSDERQDALLRYLRQRFGHVSVERVCSGLGIANLYDFLRETGAAPEAPEFAARLAAATDRTPLIVEAALDAHAPSTLCAATLNLFVTILGAEAGNLALKVLATGGVYLAGGIPPRILPLLEDGTFLHALQGKGRFVELLARLPARVIVNPQVALLGAAHYGLQRLRASSRA